MEVLSSIVVGLSEATYKPGMLEMSVSQERRKYSSVMKALKNGIKTIPAVVLCKVSLPWMLENLHWSKGCTLWGITPSRSSLLIYRF